MLGIALCLACVTLGYYYFARDERADQAYARVSDRVGTPSILGGMKAKNPPGPTTADLQPVIQARAAGVQSCLPAIASASRLTIAGTYSAISTWNLQTPNARLYSAISGQLTDDKAAPRAVSILIATPTPSQTCDAMTVEVHPSQLACDVIETALSRDGRPTTIDMTGIPLVQSDPTLRFLLVSTPMGGCVVVGVRTLYAK